MSSTASDRRPAPLAGRHPRVPRRPPGVGLRALDNVVEPVRLARGAQSDRLDWFAGCIGLGFRRRSVERGPRRRRDLRRGRSAGRRDPRAPAQAHGRPPVHRPGRTSDAPDPGVRHGHPGGLSRGQRALLQGPRAHPGGDEPATVESRPAERQRGGLLPGRSVQALRRHQDRAAGPDRAVLLLARVRPRAPGSELDDLQGLPQRPRSGRPVARAPGDLRGRRDPAHDPMGCRQPEPGRAPRRPDRRRRPGSAGRPRRGRRRSCARP